MEIEKEIKEILQECTIKGNVVYLPDNPLDRDTYVKVNKCLTGIGGKWNRKQKGHIFEDDPRELFNKILDTGKRIDLKKENQFFETPRELAIKIVAMAEITEECSVLEPSAGKGAIADEINNMKDITLIEKNETFANKLREKHYANVLCEDFIHHTGVYDRIIMNPPFTKQQDIKHILHAYGCLRSNGILVAIVSESPFFRMDSKSVVFRQFLKDTNAVIYENNAGTFKTSGTMVKSRIIKIAKVS
jgi:hypothetical protein